MTRAKLLHTHAGLLAALDFEMAQLSDPALCETSAPGVSSWSVKDHLEHLSVAHDGMVGWIERVRDGNLEVDTSGRPSRIGRVVLLFGAFPRGRGRAPERTLPTEAGPEEVAARLSGVRERVEGLGDSLGELRASRARRNHVAFGHLKPTQWLQIALIHHNHHQKIIRDVIAAVS
jgi:hypothetical protein